MFGHVANGKGAQRRPSPASTTLELEIASSGSTPTDAHLAMNALLARVILEAARRRQDDLPGLVETLQDSVVITCGGTTRQALGWFQAEAWCYGERQVHELFLNGDRRGGRAVSLGHVEDVLVTLLHEGCHVYAQANGIKDTSRDGHYHNRRFAEIALQIGLEIEKDPQIGHRTPRLSAWGQIEYSDLLAELERGLVLTREPPPARPDPNNHSEDGHLGDQAQVSDSPVKSAKYVFASCRCQTNRGRRVTIRVAAGSWRPAVIRCNACGDAFEESLTAQRQQRRGAS